ncbi:MAG: Lrp/AsnC family transcriptional regulator [Burkholderiales bacterium]
MITRRAADKDTALSSVDIKIIRCLQRDARGSLVKVAAELRMPESTIRNRVNRLVRQGLIEFAVVTNPLRFGYQIWAIIEIQAQPTKIRAVAKRLAAISEIHLVGIMTGSYDIYAGALFRDNQELLEFITDTLARIPGIQRISTSHMLDVVKRTVTFGIPDTRERKHR